MDQHVNERCCHRVFPQVAEAVHEPKQSEEAAEKVWLLLQESLS